MSQPNASRLKQALLTARAEVPQIRAAMEPVELLERQLGEFDDSAASVLDAFTVALNISDKHPQASRPFEAEAGAAGFAGADRDWAAKLLLGAEVRRGLLSYRLAGLAPREPETRLAAALAQQLDEPARQSLTTFKALQGGRVSDSDLLLDAWGEGLRRAGADPRLAAEAVQADAGRFISRIIAWGCERTLH